MSSTDALKPSEPCPRCGQQLQSVPTFADVRCTKCGYVREPDGTEYLKMENGNRVYFQRPLVLYPALDSNPTETLILTVPLKSDLFIEGRPDSKGNTETELVKDVALYTITDKAEIFSCTREEFYKRNWLVKIPDPIIDQRWSPGGGTGVQAFLFGKAPTISAAAVYRRLEAEFGRYVDMSSPLVDGAHESNVAACALYTILSYFFFVFEYIPYLKLSGAKGSAKSKVCRIFKAAGFNAALSHNIRKTTVYRYVQDSRGLLIVDEAENMAFQTENNNELLSVLNSGWERIGNVSLTDPETMQLKPWSTFSPKIISSINPVYEVLADRCFELRMFKTTNKSKSDSEVDPASEDWWRVRDELYLLLMQRWRDVQALAKSVSNTYGFSGRTWNLAKPLLVMARLVDKDADQAIAEPLIKKFLDNQARAKQTAAEDSLQGTVLLVVEELLSAETLSNEGDDYRFTLPLETVSNRVREIEHTDKLRNKRVAAMLTDLGLYRNPSRGTKTGGVAFQVSKADLEQARARRSVTEATEATDVTEVKRRGVPEGEKPQPPLNSASVPSGGSVASAAPSAGRDEVKVPGSAHSEKKASIPEVVCSVAGCEIKLGQSGIGAELSIYKIGKERFCKKHFLERKAKGGASEV
jgi:hypothetical protein